LPAKGAFLARKRTVFPRRSLNPTEARAARFINAGYASIKKCRGRLDSFDFARLFAKNRFPLFRSAL
jgi:hypothetical protein